MTNNYLQWAYTVWKDLDGLDHPDTWPPEVWDAINAVMDAIPKLQVVPGKEAPIDTLGSCCP